MKLTTLIAAATRAAQSTQIILRMASYASVAQKKFGISDEEVAAFSPDEFAELVWIGAYNLYRGGPKQKPSDEAWIAGKLWKAVS